MSYYNREPLLICPPNLSNIFRNISLFYFKRQIKMRSPGFIRSALLSNSLTNHSSPWTRNMMDPNNLNTFTLPLISPMALQKRRSLEGELDDSSSIINPFTHHQFPQTRNRQTIGTSSYYDSDDFHDPTSALYLDYGAIYVDLWVGTPPQRQTVLVDTGSQLTAFPCKECSSCGSYYHVSPPFQQDASSTFKLYPCSQCNLFYEQCTTGLYTNTFPTNVCASRLTYVDGSSWEGFKVADMTYVGGPHNTALSLNTKNNGIGRGVDPFTASMFRFNLMFYCQTSITGLFKLLMADGIMGMDTGDLAVWKQMKNAGVIKSGQFALCYILDFWADDISKNGTHAGAITLGGTHTGLHLSKMVYADAFKLDEFHGLHLRSMYFLSSSVDTWDKVTSSTTRRIDVTENDLNLNGVILDSGTTGTYLPSTVAAAFQSAWLSYVNVPYDTNGMTLTEQQIGQLPTIIFQLSGVSGNKFDVKDPERCAGLAGCLDPQHPNDILVVLLPEQYFAPTNTPYFFQPVVFFNEPSQPSFIGANLMTGYEVLFDTVGSGRIGFAISDCNYTRIVESTSPTKTSGSHSTYASIIGPSVGLALSVVLVLMYDCV